MEYDMDLYEMFGIDEGIKKDNDGSYELSGVYEMTDTDWRKVQKDVESQSESDLSDEEELILWEKGFYMQPNNNQTT